MKSITITSAGNNARADRAHRMRFYFISMSIRLACVASLFWVRGWWIVVPVVGGVVLPYIAVMIGNAVAANNDGDAPQSVEPLALEAAPVDKGESAPPLIVVDYQAPEKGGSDAV